MKISVGCGKNKGQKAFKGIRVGFAAGLARRRRMFDVFDCKYGGSLDVLQHDI